MKRLLMTLSLSFVAGLASAQAIDVTPLVGENWYGLYLNGHKSGYQVSAIKLETDGTVVITEDARFQVTMGGAKQDMHTFDKRVYSPQGELVRIEAQVEDPRPSLFSCTVQGDQMAMRTVINGVEKVTTLPKPKETVADALRYVRLLKEGAQIGDEITFTQFQPIYQREIASVSRIVGVEDRLLEGVSTKVYRIQTTLPDLGMESVSFVTQKGVTLEDLISGIIKMRLEPEQIAKDVSYSNDVIVSNAAPVKEPIKNPRTRSTLRLKLKGPLTSAHLFNDERQQLQPNGDSFDFTGRKISLAGVEPVTLPVTNPDVAPWRAGSTLVQSDHPALIEKAKEIVGAETNAAKASEKLCRWVHDNVHTTYSARLTNALEVLEHREGDCTEHSILFVGLARAAGLPAREVAGLIYVEGSNGAPPGFYFHQWASVWVGKWIDVDPTFNQPLADATHIKLAEGDLYTQTRLLPLIGQIAIEVVDEPDKT